MTSSKHSFSPDYGDAPLEPDARVHLVVQARDISSNAQLNRAETKNITKGTLWAMHQHWSLDNLFDQYILRELHRRMFCEVWTWAGTYRSHEVNIGNCPPEQISTRLEQLLGNLRYQVEFDRDAQDVVVEYHFGIVQIHPFVNGNGRHSRIAAELLYRALGHDIQELTWGDPQGTPPAERRKQYIDAIKSAERGDFDGLKAFMFSSAAPK